MSYPSNEPGDVDGPLAELLRIQAEFQTRIADESLRYLRRIQGIFEPYTPGTVLRPVDGDEGLTASGTTGGTTTLTLKVENRQRAYTVVAPTLTPLVCKTGTTWFPTMEIDPPSGLLAPDEEATLRLTVTLPLELPTGTYRGLLLLRGIRGDGIPVTIHVDAQSHQADKGAHT